MKTSHRILTLLGVGGAALLAWGLIESESPSSQVSVVANEATATPEFQWQLPEHFPDPFVPQDNPMTEAKFQLGRHLFYDKRLSGNGTQSCGSCHFQQLAFTDGLAKPIGSTGDTIARSAMSIANVAYYPTLTWANPSQYTLEIQAQVPMFVENTGVELGIKDENKDEVLARFQQDSQYQTWFAQVFPDEPQPIHFMNIVRAISAFERGVISANSRYDQALRGAISLTPLEQQGQVLFNGKAQCSQCHSGFNFSNQTYSAESKFVEKPFHNNGLYNIDGKGSYPLDNVGLIGVMPQEGNMGKFRVPSLRNIELTAPYMHDGSMATLEEVVAMYARHGRLIESGPNKGDGALSPLKDPLIDQIELDENEQKAVIAFLKTLTDHEFIANPRYADPFAVSQAGASHD